VNLSEIGIAKRVWLISACVTLVLAISAAVWITRELLLLLFAGVLFSIVLSATADWASRRLHLARSWALALTLLFSVVTFSFTVWLVGDRVSSEVQDLSQQLPDTAAALHERLAQHSWGRTVLRAMPSPEDLVSHSSEVVNKSWSAVWGILGVAGSCLVIFFVGLYLAISPSLYRDTFARLFPVSSRPRIATTLEEVGVMLGRWMLGKLCLMSFVGLFTATGLWLLGIPLVLSLALLAAALDFIPNIGPIVSAIPALLLALLSGPMSVLWVALLYLAVQFIESYILAPMVQRRAVSLPPALLISAQVLLPMLFGFPGLVLATPLTVLLLVVVRKLYVESVLEAGIRDSQRTA
jgi:predicted PurR-regulated permease PerM